MELLKYSFYLFQSILKLMEWLVIVMILLLHICIGYRTYVGLVKSVLFPKYMELTTVLVFADVINISGPSRDCREIQKCPYFTAG
jgi:hypothetical protein